jgi:DNA-binding transcriptional regulator YhcF (GntR family)
MVKYLQIKNDLKRKMLAGKYREGKIPSLRKLSETYQVSLMTVNRSIKLLENEKLLACIPGSGIIVNELEIKHRGALRQKKVASKPIHPLARYDAFIFEEPQAVKTLTLALYENMPLQKKHWTEVVKRFNSSYHEYKVVIEWLPVEICIQEKDKFDAHFKDIPCIPDIIQCQLEHNFFADLPEDISSFIQGEKCFSEQWGPNNGKPHPQKIVPLYSALPLCLWNQEMADEYQINKIIEKLSDGKIIELACEAAAKLPKNINIAGQLPNLMRFWGHPEVIDDIDIDFMESFFVPLCRSLNESNDSCERIFPLYFRNYPLRKRFLEGLHFMDFLTSNTLFMPIKEQIEFKYDTALFPLKREVLFPASCLAINKTTDKLPAAAEFLRFMLSTEIQSFTAETFFVRPYVKSAMPALYRMLNYAPETVDKYLKKIKIASCHVSLQHKYQVDFISYSLKELFDQIAKKEIDGKNAAKQALAIWQDFIKTNN